MDKIMNEKSIAETMASIIMPLSVMGMVIFGLLLAGQAYVFWSWNRNATGPVEGVIAEIGGRVGQKALHWPIYEFQTPTGLVRMPSAGIPGLLNRTSSSNPSYKVGDPLKLYYRLSQGGQYEVIEASFLDPTWFKIGTGMTAFLFSICFLLFLKFRTS